MSLYDQVYSRGGDANKNMFMVYFIGLPDGVAKSSGNGLKDSATIPSYRTKTITIPGMGVMTYDVDYLTVKLKMPGAKIEFEPQFDTEMRIDRNWHAYSDLVVWRNKLANPATGMIGQDQYVEGDVKNTRCSMISVRSMPLADLSAGGSTPNYGNFQHQWDFTKAYPSKVGDISFDYSAGDNVSITVTFGFLEMVDKGVRGDNTNLNILAQS